MPSTRNRTTPAKVRDEVDEQVKEAAKEQVAPEVVDREPVDPPFDPAPIGEGEKDAEESRPGDDLEYDEDDAGPDVNAIPVDTGFMIDLGTNTHREPPRAQSHIVASEAVTEPGHDVAGVDSRFLTPDRAIKGASEPAEVGGDNWTDRVQEQYIQEQVQKAFDKLGFNPQDILDAIKGIGAPQGTSGGSPTISVTPDPPKFKYHFRCDVSPELKIQAMDMSALDRGERPQENPIHGQWIQFRLGHLLTNDDNVAAQIKWMSERPSITGEGQTIGGNPSIYEDDGSVLFKCPTCSFVTASANGFKAHMRATHGAA